MGEKTDGHGLIDALWKVSRRAWSKRGVAWLPPACPRCLMPLSAKMGSSLLICLSCSSQFHLNEVTSTPTFAQSKPSSIVDILMCARRLQRVSRFAGKPKVQDQTVAEHIFNVAFIAMVLGDLEQSIGNQVNVEMTLRKSLLHDLDESFTGDIVSGFKHHDPKLRDLIETLSARLLAKVLPPEYLKYKRESENSIEDDLVYAADQLDVLLWCIEEQDLGNKTVDSLITDLTSLLKAINLSSVSTVLKEVEDLLPREATS